MSVALRSMQGQKALEFHQHLNLCSEDKLMSCRFGYDMRASKTDRISMFG